MTDIENFNTYTIEHQELPKYKCCASKKFLPKCWECNLILKKKPIKM